jgi:DNA polymerase-3 subunit gamma/tau
LALIARAADGSARDGLSILDQAISQAAGAGVPQVTEQAVRDMLGLADRAKVFDLFEATMRGDVKAALDLLADQYAAGASPVVVLQDLLELTHWLTRLKVAPDGANDPALAETERTRGVAMAQTLPLPALTRAWQMLLKGLGETRIAPMPLQAAEMVLVRLAYAADLPSPADAVKALGSGGAVSAARPVPAPAPSGGARASAVGTAQAVNAPPMRSAMPETVAKVETPQPQSFVEVVALFEQHREAKLASHLKSHVGLVRFEQGVIEFNPLRGAPTDLAGQVGKLLTQWCGQRWVASVVNTPGAPSLREQEIDQAKADPVVKSILENFPGATIEAIRRADET